MPAVEMQNITKSFGGNRANDSVCFKAGESEIHALVGENGAGKTTLMKILYGMYRPDEGRILINGKEQVIDSPGKAISLGIGMVHQHFMLAGRLTVMENIILGDEPVKAFGLIDYDACREKINSLTKSFNIKIDHASKTETLPVGTQQKVEILKLLYRNADILILDEPTAVLTPQETGELFATLRELREKGKTIILITHKLGEVLSVCDSVTVLRHGRSAGEMLTSETGKDELARLIVGGNIEPVRKAEPSVLNNIILKAEAVTVLDEKKIEAVKEVSFDIKAGEILGIAGVEGNGQAELVEAICGMREYSGSITVNGKPMDKSYPVAHIPADRHKYGIVMEYSIAQNIILGRQSEPQFSTPFLLKENEIRNYAGRLIDEYDIRPADPDHKAGGLSGGNQQKAVAARELTKKTGVIIASHPTRGLDIKAAAFVHSSLLKEAGSGKAVLVVSSDLGELLSLCSRIAVMYNGRITAVLNAHTATEQEIGKHMTGINNDEINSIPS